MILQKTDIAVFCRDRFRTVLCHEPFRKVIPITLPHTVERAFLLYLISSYSAGMFSVQVRSVQGTLLNTDLVLHLERRIRHAGGFVIRIGGTIYENKENDIQFLIATLTRRHQRGRGLRMA